MIYPELSYRIVGCAFEVFRQLGAGLLEKHYQRAMARALAKAGLKYVEQVRYQKRFDGFVVATGYVDFMVEEKVVVELKRGRFFFESEMEQVHQYLNLSGKKLGLIIRFTTEGARYKRVLNIDPEKMKRKIPA